MEGFTLGDMDVCSQVQGLGMRSHWRLCTGDTRCRIRAGMSSWIFCNSDLRYRVGRVSSGHGRYLTPGTGSGRAVTLEIVRR